MIYIIIYSVLMVVCLCILYISFTAYDSELVRIVAYGFSVWMIFCLVFYIHKYVTKTEIFSVTTISERLIDDDGYLSYGFERYSYENAEPTGWVAGIYNDRVVTPEQHDQLYVAKTCTCRLLRSGCTNAMMICGRDWEGLVQFLLGLSPMYAHKSDDERCKWKKYYFSTGLSTLSWYGKLSDCWWDSGATAPMLEKE